MTPDDVTAELDRPATSLRAAAEILGIGKTNAYNIAGRVTRDTGRGDLIEGVPVLRVGGRYSVPTAPLRAALGIDELRSGEQRESHSATAGHVAAGLSDDRLDRLLDALLVELLIRRLPAVLTETGQSGGRF